MTRRGSGLGIDFGTSNTVAGHAPDGRPQLIGLEAGATTMPTTFFFDAATRGTLLGGPANRALLEGREGRFMRALKRVLGTPLMHEQRMILTERISLSDLIARFLHQVRARAEAQTGLTFDRVLSGRPVVFHGTDDPREQQAEDDLRACYLAAGFREVDFMPEPEAAAIAAGATHRPGATGLIVDVGGGTSDFSVFRAGDGGVTILASHGVRIGGTDFDRAISLDHVMPLLGRGTRLRKAMGPGHSPVPNAIFADLATWERIPFVNTPQNRRLVAEMARLAEQPQALADLAAVLEEDLGHDLAFAVEAGKIAANDGDAAIRLDAIRAGLSAPLARQAMADSLSRHAAQLREGATETLRRAGLSDTDIDQVIYVGGSSLLSIVQQTLRAQFPDADHRAHEVFTAVADGLAIAAA
ncbi:Hsp70 family protein [Paracoccus hibiscisoli]|uniref:Hsp70 family protein n=1 Tax=Paracoccus hibiscisoli TaxID=2023261 RepID=A0A4U0QJC9_9RHOB|nr:Hsp70 family protein [Paracoccus hibiscisoli]TJZ81811.1 Hsp70 family protein [Paracoccus hibiscisoli]